MTEPLPPDLSRLGDALARATERDARSRARRRDVAQRFAATAAAAAMAIGVFLPGVLGGGEQPSAAIQLASSTTMYSPTACDQPRGATFRAARPCGSPGATDASPELARRYAER